MFKKTSKTQQLSVFSSNHTLLNGRSLKIFEDNLEWHNQFRTQVVERIDEDIFRPLFNDGFGAPNASIRVLIGMFILKDAQGLSDSQLFGHCRFNIQYRSALGLHNLDDSLPTESTYYLLRKRIFEWERDGRGDLFAQARVQVTKSQILEFNIDGKKIRMDSKLLGSNIAWYNRYELIHESLRLAYVDVKDQVSMLFPESELTILRAISGESGNKVSYRSNRTELETRLAQLGSIIYTIINYIKDDTTQSIKTLRQVFEQQYEVIENTVLLLPKQQIKATSIQSPQDTDCHFRQKGDEQIKGYSINVTETCSPDNDLNLITDVTVESSSFADCDYVKPAVQATQQIVSQPIETLNSDGAYHSVSNEIFCQEMGIDHIIGGIQGRLPRYTYSFNEANELEATDMQTNKIFLCDNVKPRKNTTQRKWVFRDDVGKLKYITQTDIDTSILRKQIASRTREELNRRNNVEATIFQLGYHYRSNKSSYRGLSKHRMWANARCLWINFVRIMKHLSSLDPITPNTSQNEANCVTILGFLHLGLVKLARLIFISPWMNNFHLATVKIGETYDF